MNQYIGADITSNNNDTIVKRDELYIYSFTISKLEEHEAVKDIKVSTHQTFDKFTETTWDIDLDNWENLINIQEQEMEDIKDNTLQLTGDYYNPIKYKVFFNDRMLKESSIYQFQDITDTVAINSEYFNNNVDGNIKIQIIDVSTDNKIIKEFTQKLTLINTKPFVLIGDIINNRLSITINDKEKDKVKINIKLNNNTIFPINGQEFSDYVSVPYFYSKVLNSDQIHINPHDFKTPNNTITVTVIDEYGAISEPLVKHFVGQFTGLMFTDANYEYLCDDSNNYNEDKNIIKDLYLGKIQAGQKSKKVMTYIKNNSDNILTNIQLKLDTSSMKTGTEVRIGQYITDNFSKMSNIINFTDVVLMPNQTIPFYIQSNVDILSEGGGYFYVDVIADTQ